MNKTDLVMKWIVGAVLAMTFALAGWNLQTTVGHDARISVMEERTTSVSDRLQRIENKLDRLIERR